MLPHAQVLPQRGNRARPWLEWEADRRVLTLHNDRDVCEYAVGEFGADGGRGVRLTKLSGGTDKAERVYCLFVCGRTCAVSCECKGYTRYGYCRHSDAVQAVITNGWL